MKDTSLVPLNILLPQDRYIVALTDRQRYLLFFENAARLTKSRGYLEALGETLKIMARKMRLFWPETEEASYYPAFQME